MEEEKQRELCVVMFPWLGYGHITPFVALAKTLSSHGLKIFFVSTPLNIERIKPQMWDAPEIDLVELAMPSVEGLPAGVESSADAGKGGHGPLLFQAVEVLEKPFEALLRELSPDWVIHDIPWIPRVAAKLAIPTILFLTLGMASFSFSEGQLDSVPENPTTEDLIMPPPGFPSQIIRRRLFEARKALGIYHKHPDGLSLLDRISICVRESEAVACNTCLELEGAYVDYFQSLRKRPVFPVGILMPKLPPRPADDICL